MLPNLEVIFCQFKQKKQSKALAHHILLLEDALRAPAAPLPPYTPNPTGTQSVADRGSPYKAPFVISSRKVSLVPANFPFVFYCQFPANVACIFLRGHILRLATPPLDCPGKNWMQTLKGKPAEAGHYVFMKP